MDASRLSPAATPLACLAITCGVFGLAATDTWEWTARSLLLLNLSVTFIAAGGAYLLLQKWDPYGAMLARPVEACLVIAAVGAMAGFIHHTGQRQFGGYDLSILLEAGWRSIQGQHPLTDYPCTLPPSYIWGISAAFRIGGVGWYSVIWFTIIASIVSLLWMYALLRALPSLRPFALLLSCALLAQTFLVTDYWYYNQWASIVVVLVALSAAVATCEPRSWRGGLSLSCALAALALGKPNAWIAGLCLAPLLTSRSRLRMLVLASAGAAALTLLLAAFHHYNLLAMLRMYRELAASRGNPWTSEALASGGKALEHATIATAVVYLLPMVVALGLLRCNPRRMSVENRTLIWVAIGAMIAGIYAALTNMELKVSDLAPECLGTAIAVLALLAVNPAAMAGHEQHDPPRSPAQSRTHVLWFALAITLLASLSGIVHGWTRTRIYATGEGYYERQTLHRLNGPRPLRSIRCGEMLQRTVDQLQDLISHNPDARYFFGGRIDFAYAVWRLSSPKSLPIWWIPGTAYPNSQDQELHRRFVHQNFDLIVFHKNDLPGQEWMVGSIADRYIRDDGTYRDLTVFRRRIATP